VDAKVHETPPSIHCDNAGDPGDQYTGTIITWDVVRDAGDADLEYCRVEKWKGGEGKGREGKARNEREGLLGEN